MAHAIHVYWREKKPPRPARFRERRTVEVLERPTPPPHLKDDALTAWNRANPVQVREVIAKEVAALEHFTSGPFLAELKALAAELDARGETVLVETYAMQPEAHLVSDGKLIWRRVFRKAEDFDGITDPGGPLHPSSIDAAISESESKAEADLAKRLRLAQIANQERAPTPEERAELDAAIARFLTERE